MSVEATPQPRSQIVEVPEGELPIPPTDLTFDAERLAARLRKS